MKPSFQSLFPAGVVTFGLLSIAGAFGFRDPVQLNGEQTDTVTTALTAGILESGQFAHRVLDDSMAEKFLNRYLDTLDPGHMLFLQSDTDEFSRHRASLAHATRREGDASLAHLVFKRYLERIDQRVALASALLKEGEFDFTSDETFLKDRSKEPRPADAEAAKGLWKQELRYEYLQEKLAGKKHEEIVKTLSRRHERTASMMKKYDEDAVLEMYLEALAQTYDPHSSYMGAEQLKSFEISMQLSLIGIGASLRSLDGYCKIMEFIPGGPALRSGLLSVGDRIVGVAQKEGDEFTDAVDLPINQVVDLIRGKKGTPVILEIIPADAADESIRKTVSIVREEVKLEEQQAKAQVIDLPSGASSQRIGVIQLPSFYAGEGFGKGSKASASADVEKLIHKLKQEKVTGIILDLRLNGGGSLQEAIDLTGLFIPTGPVVQTRDSAGKLDLGIDRDPKVVYDGPLVVLTSRFSASASEIVAGALQDYGRALIVGDSSTFGKGTVQKIVSLNEVMDAQGMIPSSDPGAIKLTFSKFYRPSGKSTQLEGVKADIVIPSFSDLPEIGESDLKNPLPWDTVGAAEYEKIQRVDSSLARLRSRSSERTTTDPDFSEFKTDIERLRKMREDPFVSLNEAKRKKEKDQLKARAEALKKARLSRNVTPPTAYEITVQNVSTPGLGDPVKPKEPAKSAGPDAEANDEFDVSSANDIVLQEAQKILIDYVGLLGATPVVSQR